MWLRSARVTASVRLVALSLAKMRDGTFMKAFADKGVVVARAFEPLSKAVVKQIAELGTNKIRVVDTTVDDGIVIKCMKKDPTKNEEEALKDIYRRLRPGELALEAHDQIPDALQLVPVDDHEVPGPPDHADGAVHHTKEEADELEELDRLAEILGPYGLAVELRNRNWVDGERREATAEGLHGRSFRRSVVLGQFALCYRSPAAHLHLVLHGLR